MTVLRTTGVRKHGSVEAETRKKLDTFLADIQESARELEDNIVALRVAINESRSMFEEGLSLSQTMELSSCPALRESAADLATHFIDLLHDYRAETVRVLVDEEGWSISDVARHTGNARQVVGRLYHAAEHQRDATRPGVKVRMDHRGGFETAG